MLCCKRSSEFHITAAFKASAVNKLIAGLANFKTLRIKNIITFICRLYFCNISLYQLIIIAVAALKKQTSFTFLFIHYISIMNFTTLQAGSFAIKPSAVNSKSVNSVDFTAFLFSKVLWASIAPVRISALTDLTSESAI